MTGKMPKNIESIVKTDTDFRIYYETKEQAKINILNSHVFRYYMSPSGQFREYPEPNKPDEIAKINVKNMSDYDKQAFEGSTLSQEDNTYIIKTDKIEIHFDKIMATMSVYDKRTNKEVFKELQALSYDDIEVTQTLHQRKDENFFGGGMQNGRFTHRGKIIKIVNTNEWNDGGVASPCPFYWSSYGYGVLMNTWKPGTYDFGSNSLDTVKTKHFGDYFDAFYFINSQPKDILNDYYELTGQPIMLPEYAYYEAHLNAFNRDYWVKVSPETNGAILFEDGYYYKSYQPNQIGDKHGILESLNGEKDNYQFSARAMIDRYIKHDLPLGWFVPNDGYGSGYGQTDSLDGDIQNLKEFGYYSRSKGVEVALWTESNLEPVDPLNPKKGDRDLGKEVSVAGVVALKCDVAWIGYGYSFGLNAVENATNIFVKSTNARPVIIMVDGWAATQRYSGIWSGDQHGGQWEYIRFHIPTYIGTGLSGQPIVGSDMDGIYGGKNKYVNIRDYQWKAFTPLQLNMDGWGTTPKTPFSFGEEALNINRAYLKLKSMLMPYNYSLGYESIHGLPMVRAMFLEFPEEEHAYSVDTQYQYMWGPSILVAPIYNDKQIDNLSIRNDVYLPNSRQIWIDFFTGEKYQGGKVLNNIKSPVWKIPVFIKDGAIIPMVNPNNNPYEINRSVRIFNLYPNGVTSFDVYEDDGISSSYLKDSFATTNITTVGPASNEQGDLHINIHKTKGTYKKIVKERTTILQVMASEDVKGIKLSINGEPLQINKVETQEAFDLKHNVYFFKKNFIINPYLKNLAGDIILHQSFLLIKLQSIDVTTNEVQIKIKDYVNRSKIFGSNSTVNKNINTPSSLKISNESTTPTSITIGWDTVEEALYYEAERDGIIFTNLQNRSYTFENLQYNSKHSFRVRSVNYDGVSEWTNAITGFTKEDPNKNIIQGVLITSNLLCLPGQETCPSNSCNNTIVKVYLDLREVYDIEKIEYIPREATGTLLQFQYKLSTDGKNWTPASKMINFNHDVSVKRIDLTETKFRFMEVNVLNSVGCFGSGEEMLFYKKAM